jgi:Ca2+-binding EF-hand superfamily protein
LRLYRRADRDKDGELDAREFARTFDVEASNPFLERLVRLFDVSGDGKLSPFEFVVCLSQFTNSSNVNRDAHVYFAWRLFDTNDDGSMSKPEFTEALRATYFRVRAGDVTGDGKKSSRRVVGDGGMRRGRGLANFGGTGGMAKGLDAIMRDVDGDKDGRVTVREFSRMTKDYPHVIAPAFDLWTKLAQVGQPATRARAGRSRPGGMLKDSWRSPRSPARSAAGRSGRSRGC